MRVQSLWIYPIKGARGIALEQVRVMATGFEYDRHWMIVNPQGQFMTQRQHPQLARLVVAITPKGLRLSLGENLAPMVIPLAPTGTECPVQVWRTETIGLDQGEAIAQWLSHHLATPCRLVAQSPHHPRPTDPAYAPGGQVSFADGYPVLLTNTASLKDLNERIEANQGEPVGMERFRPNLVIESGVAFGEDAWRSLSIGAVNFKAVKGCDRCIVTTTDQHTGARNPNKEPLKTLATFRQRQGKVYFGENLIPQTEGVIQVGDEVTITL
ncbi:MAG: MOSC domain-containing protein [Spirulina sp. DLM2.Bin59]|nr:MAG: MOSC domain-containing protein [Spirulina sp. DLM2.Bin59]